jgi:hypothetical protein
MTGHDPRLALSSRANTDSAADLDPESSFWHDAPRVFFATDNYGHPFPDHRSEVRSRWTPKNLYFLFVCPYVQLHLRPNLSLTAKTWELWNWDVAEAFIGSERDPIHIYREFELSPQREWLDLSIDLRQPDKIADHDWRSGCEVDARIDAAARIWYGFLRVPWACVETGPAAAGNRLRINFFRSQGPQPIELAWQAPQQASFHVPERFGTLLLA